MDAFNTKTHILVGSIIIWLPPLLVLLHFHFSDIIFLDEKVVSVDQSLNPNGGLCIWAYGIWFNGRGTHNAFWHLYLICPDRLLTLYFIEMGKSLANFPSINFHQVWTILTGISARKNVKVSWESINLLQPVVLLSCEKKLMGKSWVVGEFNMGSKGLYRDI